MKVSLTFVPPGGGEADYGLDFDLPAVPQPGDYISVRRPGEIGTSDFIVKRAWWGLSYPTSESDLSTNHNRKGSLNSIVVECEFAKGPYSTPSHTRACESYQVRKGKSLKFEETAY